jgi:hypothetical protein
VYLYTRNLRTKQLSKGLNNVKVRLFLISKQNRPVTYTLKLPPDAKIHPRFYISKLEPANPTTLLQRTFRYKAEEENKYKVKRILDYNNIEQIKLRQYLVK